MNCNQCYPCGGDPQALRYVSQIAENKANIACLGGRADRNEQDIRDRYTREEVDRLLAAKADKCAFEKHLLLHGGCPPCDCEPPEPCNCDSYTREEVDRLLESKADISKEWKSAAVEYVDGVSYGSREAIRYFVQGRTIIVEGSIGIYPGAMQLFTKIADLALPTQLKSELNLYCTGVMRGTSANYQDQQHTFRLKTPQDAAFPTNKLELVATRRISVDYQEPEDPYTFLFSGYGVVPEAI